MMNKALEVIEARWLFDIAPENQGRHPPAADRALHGAVQGFIGAGATGHTRYARAHCLWFGLARAHCQRDACA